MEIEKLKSIIESVLFVSGEPVKISKIAKIAEVKTPEVENALMILSGEYAQNRGMIIIEKDGFVQMATSPENAGIISDLIKSEIQENLSQPALEILSIVAYRGPITRAGIESIRGVNCSFTLRTLLMRGLLERVDNPKDGRGYLYKVSMEFLKKLGLESAKKLPDWETLSQDSRIENIMESN